MPTPRPVRIGRRDFLRTAGGAVLYAALPGSLFARTEDSLTLSIFHTTDLHGHITPTVDYDGRPDLGGLARCASQIRRWRRESPHHLLLDIGDVYQGTQAGLGTRGRIMIDAFNHLRYDAWVIGNHEFDWGIEPVQEALARSDMPVLCANCTLQGARPAEFPDSAHPFARVRPFLLREVAGLRLGIVGVTTPGMPYWLHESLYEGFEFFDPIEPVRRAIEEIRAAGVDAILLAGHMGLTRTGGDDYANRTVALLEAFPEVVAFLGGHTHVNVPERTIHGRPFTQASYHGIHAGRLDLTFDRTSRRLLHVRPSTVLMDSSVPLDPGVMSQAANDLEEADAVLATRAGRLGAPLSMAASPGAPSPYESLMGAAMIEAMARRGIVVDGVIHGSFFSDETIPAGNKTVADLWKMVPYENRIVTARLTRSDLFAITREICSDFVPRSLLGMSVSLTGRGSKLRIREIFDAEGHPLHPFRRYTIALNSYDAQSGGNRYLQLRDILRQKESGMTLHPLLTRDALIDYFAARDVVLPQQPARREAAELAGLASA